MILAVDPGSTTGFAIRTSSGGTDYGQQEADAFVDWVAASACSNELFAGLHTVVCEQFIINPATVKKSRAGMHDALDVIGALRFLARHHGWNWVMQPPAARTRVTDEMLVDLGWDLPGQPHARDAARHLVVFETRRGQL